MARRKRSPQTSTMRTLPAPLGGWNARDSLVAMKPTDAITLDNWFVDQTGDLRTRGGRTEHASGLGSAVHTLMTYQASVSDPARMFAVAGGSIFNVTNLGAVGAAVVTGLTSPYVESCTMTVLGGAYLFIGNGVDAPKSFNGTTWSAYAPTGTGLTLTKLTSPTVLVNRLWWIEKGTLTAWFGDPGAIGGTLTSFPMGSIFQSGGELIAMASWTRDGGNGPDDYTVFISSTGEALIYEGQNPTSPTTWAKVGIFKLNPPLGRRCTMKAGADLAVLTTNGAVLLSQVLDSNVSGQSAVAVTNKILGAFINASRATQEAAGWQIIEYPQQGLVFVNVPAQPGVEYHQYVLTTAKGTWGRFKAMNGTCWVLFNGKLFQGGLDGKVYRYDPDMETDDGRQIEAFVQTAFSDLGTPQNKKFEMCKPLMQGPVGYAPRVSLRLNYDVSPPLAQAVGAFGDGPTWDQWQWDVQYWGVTRVPTTQWMPLSGIGQRMSIAFRVTTEVALTFNSADIQYQVGGGL